MWRIKYHCFLLLFWFDLYSPFWVEPLSVLSITFWKDFPEETWSNCNGHCGVRICNWHQPLYSLWHCSFNLIECTYLLNNVHKVIKRTRSHTHEWEKARKGNNWNTEILLTRYGKTNFLSWLMLHLSHWSRCQKNTWVSKTDCVFFYFCSPQKSFPILFPIFVAN